MDKSTQPDCANAIPPQATREKYWEELDDAGKIARLRQVVKNLESQIVGLSNAAYKALSIAKDHQHAASTGDVLIPARPSSDGAELSGRRRDDKWF